MCVEITEKDIVTEEDIIAYKVVHLHCETVDGREVYCSQYRPDQRWNGYNNDGPLGTLEYYEIGQFKTDTIGDGFYLYSNITSVRYDYTSLEVTIPKGTIIHKGLDSQGEYSIISKTILPLRVLHFGDPLHSRNT